MRRIDRIVVIGLSNIGDAILMSPVVERLHTLYPSAHLTLLVGERARALFVNDPRVHRLWCMDEFAGLTGRLRLVRAVWQMRPDMLVDLRTTLLPLVWRPWRILRSVRPLPRTVTHMRERHLWRLSRQLSHLATWPLGHPSDGQTSLWISQQETADVDRLVSRWGLDSARRVIVICPGARSHIKRWSAEGFASVADRLIEEAEAEVVFTGEPDEAPLIEEILRTMRHRAHNAAGSTTIQQLAALMQRARLVITNDSASLHLACAVNVPVLALFGPTDPRKYGPTGARDRVIQRRLFCVPCEQALCRFHHECMRFITPDEVHETARQMLESGTSSIIHHPSPIRVAPKRILVIRLDRIGDVVLSTPVLQALREAYPTAFIAMMVQPACRELVEDHPSLDETILYDKEAHHKGIASTIRFALDLRRFRFDTALVLHPTNRSHWISVLAGIPVRIGYDRKSGWLLTHRVAHRKQEGAKHEAEYTLDLVRVLGLEPSLPRPVIPIRPEADARVQRVLAEQGVGPEDVVVAIHPSATALSKRWKPERFAQVADRLIDAHRVRLVLVTGPEHAEHAQAVERAMRQRPINLAGTLSVGELACLFRRCRVLLSNDSGPVHVAAAVGTPVVDLFGRSQPGLNPARWRALGPNHVVLLKDVGHQVPLPPHGEYESPALAALTVEEVYQAVARLLARSP